MSLPWQGFLTAPVLQSCCCPTTGHPCLRPLRGVPALAGVTHGPSPSGCPPSFGMEHLLPRTCLQHPVSHPSPLPLSPLNLPEVLRGRGLFMPVPESFGTICDRLRAASPTGHRGSPLLPKPCPWCPIRSYSADFFSNLVLKFYSAKTRAQTDLNVQYWIL